MTETAPTSIDEIAPNPPVRNAAVLRCCAARDLSLGRWPRSLTTIGTFDPTPPPLSPHSSENKRISSRKTNSTLRNKELTTFASCRIYNTKRAS